jgi:hypothetical protein
VRLEVLIRRSHWSSRRACQLAHPCRCGLQHSASTLTRGLVVAFADTCQSRLTWICPARLASLAILRSGKAGVRSWARGDSTDEVLASAGVASLACMRQTGPGRAAVTMARPCKTCSSGFAGEAGRRGGAAPRTRRRRVRRAAPAPLGCCPGDGRVAPARRVPARWLRGRLRRARRAAATPDWSAAASSVRRRQPARPR